MSPYILHCTVCENDFTTRAKWLRHLLESEHQNKTRDQFFQWDYKIKECVLVAFSSFQVAKCDAILQYFSSSRRMEDEGFAENDHLVIVTDFVWFPQRPFVGFLQFESRAKVDSIMRRSNSLEVRIDNQLVQLKKATDYMQLEWEQLLPMANETFHPDPNMTENNVLITNGHNSSAPKPILPENTSITINENNEAGKDCSFESLPLQFASIRKEMAIPDRIYKDRCFAAIKLESAFSDRFPNVRANLFRNDYLALYNGIKCTGNDQVLIFLLTKSEYSTNGDGEVSWTTGETLNTFEEVFNTPNARYRFKGRVVATDQEILCGSTFISNFPALKFNIITDARLLPEVQACLLLKYMMRFDSRMRSLFTLVRYWAKINELRISVKTRKSFEPPETSNLDWLLIFFLCHTKILPTPRQIQQNPHEPLLLDGVDVGFSEDSRYPTEWRLKTPAANATWSTFTDMLPLLLDFFQFLDSEIFGPGCQKVIFNTRDGDIIKKKDVLPTEARSRVTQQMTYLTEDEMAIVRTHRRMKSEAEYNIFILHPLYLPHFCDLKMGRRLWTHNKMITSQTINQLETSFRKCGASCEVELIGDFRLREILCAKIGPESTS